MVDLPAHPVAEFLFQLSKMLTEDNRQYIEWINGKIEVYDPQALADNVLGKYFRHSKYASFQRQLNYFGFRKIAGKGKMAPCSYINDAATRDLKSLLSIRRKATVSNTKRRKQQAAQANKNKNNNGRSNSNADGARKRQKKTHVSSSSDAAVSTIVSPVNNTHQAVVENADNANFDLSDSFLGVGPAFACTTTTTNTANTTTNDDNAGLLEDCTLSGINMDEHFSFIVPNDALNFILANEKSTVPSSGVIANDDAAACDNADIVAIDDAHCPNAAASAAMEAAVSAATQQQDFFESSLSFLDTSTVVDHGEVTDDSGCASSCDSSLVDLAMLPELDDVDGYSYEQYSTTSANYNGKDQDQRQVVAPSATSYYQSQRFKGKTKPPLITMQSGPVALVG